MGGADSVDIVAFHRQHVLKHGFPRNGPSEFSAELMPVCALENNPLVIQHHQAVL